VTQVVIEVEKGGQGWNLTVRWVKPDYIRLPSLYSMDEITLYSKSESLTTPSRTLILSFYVCGKTYWSSSNSKSCNLFIWWI